MMKPVGTILAAIARKGGAMQAGAGRDAMQGLADAFAALVEKRAGKTVKPESVKDEMAAIAKPGMADDASASSPALLPELVLAAAEQHPDEAKLDAPVRPSRKAARVDSEAAKPQPVVSLPMDAVMPAAGDPVKANPDAPEPQAENDPDLPDQPAQPAKDAAPDVRAEGEEQATSASSRIVFARQETHFDTARFAWTTTGAALPMPAPEVESAAPPRVSAAAFSLAAPQASETLKSLTLEIDPGLQNDAVTATLKLRQDQLEVRLETVDSDMAQRLRDAASALTQSLEQGGYRVETVVVQKGGSPADSTAFMQAMANQDRSGRSRGRAGREGRMGDERTVDLRRARAGDIVV